MIVSDYQKIVKTLIQDGFGNYMVDSIRPHNDDVMVTLINPESFEDGKDSYTQMILVMSKAGEKLNFRSQFVDV